MPRYTVSGTPIPFDDEGSELCLLYLKYGRCRYGKKCKKSHRAWFPPLPDEEPPRNPPLPSTSPPHSPEEQHPPLGGFQLSSFFETLPITVHPELELCLKGQNKLSTETTLTSPVIYKPKETQGNGPGAVSGMEKLATISKNAIEPINTLTSNQAPIKTAAHDGSLIHNNQEADKRVGVDSEQTSGPVLKTVLKEGNISIDTNSEKLERIYTKLSKGNSLFGHVYKTQTTVYQSGVDKLFQDAGAYFNRQFKKLEVKKSPVNKVEQHYLKLMKRLHWKISQSLLHKLAEIPPVYMLNVDLPKVNFTRLKPYAYLLIHECFSSGSLKATSRLPSLFTVLVSDTLLTQFEHKNLSPLEAEKKLCSWGAGPVMVRKCIKELWSTISRSSVSSTGVAAEVLRCEQGVHGRNLRFLDYAFACSLAAGEAKAGAVERKLKNIKVSKSVKQGLKSVKERRVSICGRGHGERWPARQQRQIQTRTHLNVPKLPATKQDYSVTSDLYKETLIDSSTKTIPVMDKSNCVNTTKLIRGKLNNNKRKKLDDIDELQILSRQRKRKRSRQFKGTSKEERQKLETKFRRVLELQLPDAVA